MTTQDHTTNKTHLADALGISRPTLYDYLREDILPAEGPKGWSIPECREAIDRHREEQNRRTPEGELRDELTLKQAERIRGRARNTRERAERIDRKLARTRREYPSRAALQIVCAGMAGQIRANLETLTRSRWGLLAGEAKGISYTRESLSDRITETAATLEAEL